MDDQVRQAARDRANADLREWLESRRWFADKGRGVTALKISDVLLAPVGDDMFALAIADMGFADGASARYFLSLVYPDWISVSAAARETGLPRFGFGEAADTAWFGSWLLARFDVDAGDTPPWRFVAAPQAARALANARNLRATAMRAEQSNTSLRFGEAVIVKLIRRLQPGPNPDAEMLRALASVGFAQVPRFLGEASWQSSAGDEYPLALVQAFVRNDGDGWSWLLRRLAAVAAGAAEPAAVTPAIRLLGRRTGELHVALSQVPAPDFAPEPASEPDVAREIARIELAAEDAIALLAAGDSAPSDQLPATWEDVAERVRAAATRADGLRGEVGLARIRVHGDFHLGQTLRTVDGDWMIIDFEGEPARPVAERRRKTSPLKDVAGMLRSFSYARGATERSLPNADAASLERLARWEREARAAYVDAYREAVRAAALPLAPVEDAAFARALAAWEVDKALYEIAYEARNRPDWIGLPLRAFMGEASP